MTTSNSHLSQLITFFFNDTAPTEIYTLSLHDALPISAGVRMLPHHWCADSCAVTRNVASVFSSFLVKNPMFSLNVMFVRSEEHTSELQSQFHLVCRLLLEKKKLYIII